MARTIKSKSKTKRIKVKDNKRKTSKVTIGLDGSIKKVGKIKIDDAFSNQWARIGFGTDALINKTEYPLTRMTFDYNLFNSLFRDNWLVQNIVSLIPEDMLKNWFKLKIDIDPEMLDRFDRVVRKTRLKQKLLDGLKWGRLYGGAVGLILIEGQDEELEKELDLESIDNDSFKGLYILDRWTGVEPSLELIDDINDPDFGEPKYYTIVNNENNLNAKVHHSRIVKFIGRKLPYYERIAEQYWGSSEIESVYQEVIKRDNVSNNIANLTFKANLAIYEMENVDQLFAIAGTQAQKRFWDMINAQSILESNFGTRVINKGDGYHKEQYSFAGLPEVYDSIMMDVAGATHIPVTKLFGRSPAGMNSTGESDLQNYYDYIIQIREAQLTPIIDKLLPIIAMSTFGEIPKDLDFEYNDVRTLTDENKANIGNQIFNTLLQSFQMGAITQKTLLKELNRLSDKYDLFVSLDEQDIERAQDKTLTEMQNMQDPMAGLSLGEEEGDNGEEQIPEQSMEGVDGQNNQETNDEETSQSQIFEETINNITNNKSRTIESGDVVEKPIIGPSEPKIEENKYEELKIEPDNINKSGTIVERIVNVVKNIIEYLKGE